MASNSGNFVKDGAASLDYSVDWSAWLADDTIDASSWTVAGDDDVLEVDTDEHTDTTATVWLSAGTTGETYKVTNQIVTAGGRTDERTIRVMVRDR